MSGSWGAAKSLLQLVQRRDSGREARMPDDIDVRYGTHVRGGRGTATVIATALLVTALAGCDDDEPSADPPTVPGGLSTATSEGAQPTGTTAPAPTSTTTSTTLNPVPSIELPTTTSTTLALPPVTTLVPEVPADLLTPAQQDPTDPRNNRPVLPEHLPVLEAYLSRPQVTPVVSSTWPHEPGCILSYFGGRRSRPSRSPQSSKRPGRLDRGEVLDVSQGVTFRPYVVGPVTDTAVVFDCEIAGHYWIKVDTGRACATRRDLAGGPGRVVEVASAYDIRPQ